MTENTAEIVNLRHLEELDLRYKERLSDEHLINLLSSLGNNEPKAITLLLMKPGIVYTTRSLARLVNDSQGEAPGWKISTPLPFVYCEKSFADIGLVAQRVTDKNENQYGYVKTEDGVVYGNCLGALLLDFSLRHPEIPLNALLGATSSPSPITIVESVAGNTIEYKKRSVGTRLWIFYELLTRDLPVREVDLTNALKYDHAIISSNLRQLQRYGIIQHESRGNVEHFVQYKVLPAEDIQFPILDHGDKTVTDTVYRVLQSEPDKYWSVAEVTERVKERLTSEGSVESVIRNVDRIQTKFSSRVYRALSLLKSQDLALVKEYSGGSQSVINLTPEQCVTIHEFLSIISRFQDRDVDIINEGFRRARSFSSQDFATLMAKAREQSPHVSPNPDGDSATVLNTVRNNPGLTKGELYKRILEEGTAQFSFGKLEHMLKVLRDHGTLKIGEDRLAGKYRWFVSAKPIDEDVSQDNPTRIQEN